MRWSTKCTYVDLETGEELRKEHVAKGIYIAVEIITKTEKLSSYENRRNVTYKCIRNPQQTLSF